MKIADDELLRQMRKETTHCEWCKRPRPCDPHHLWKRGLGGGFRLDLRQFIAMLCRECHDMVENSPVAWRERLLPIVARRVGMTVEAIREQQKQLRGKTS